MSDHRCRTVEFANHRVSVASVGEFASSLIAFALPDALDAGDESAPDPSTFIVESRPGTSAVAIGRDGQALYSGSVPADAVRFLIEAISLELSTHARGGLLIHAAATLSDTGAIVIPGASGTGKTTLAAHLAALGHHYLTDELVFLPGPDPQSEIDGLTRPLHVKPQGRSYLPDVSISAGWDAWSGELSTMVRPHSTAALGASRQMRALVFPRRRPGSVPVLTTVSKADAAARLMGTLLNARNLDAHGLPAVIALVGQVPAMELAYENAAEAAACLTASPALTC